MGFYNIMLEGEQAEEYLMRKKAEEKKKEDANKKHAETRVLRKGHDTSSADIRNNASNVEKRDYDRRNLEYDVAISKADMAAKKHGIFSDEANKAYKDRSVKKKNYNNYTNAIFNDMDSTDSIERHMRRHPDQWEGSKRIKTRSEACGIFEYVEFLNETTSQQNTERKAILKFCKKQLRSSKLCKFIDNNLENDKNIETVNIWITYPDSDKYEYSYNDFVEGYEDSCEICDIYQNPSYAATKDGADFDKYISEFIKELNKKLKEAWYNATVDGGMYGKTGTITVKVK